MAGLFILSSVSAGNRPRVLVGFAMETRDLVANAQKKMQNKGLDLVVANHLHEPGAGFAVDTNVVTLLHADGRSEALPIMSKEDVAGAVLDQVVALLDS